MSTTIADRLDRAIRRLPPLPDVASRLLAIVDEPEFSIEDIVHVVRNDPNLTARILKLCNSSLYSRTEEVESVQEAVSYLGARSLVQVVVSTCTRVCFDALTSSTAADPAQIRRHAFACASAAERVAERVIGPSPGAAFTAGILHDLGKVALLQAAGPAFSPAPPEPSESILDHERRVFGTDHASVAERIADRWPLPHELRRAITHHHDAEHIAVEPPMTAALHVAEVLADTVAASREQSPDVLARVEPNALARLSLDVQDLEPLLQATREAWSRADRMLADDRVAAGAN